MVHSISGGTDPEVQISCLSFPETGPILQASYKQSHRGKREFLFEHIFLGSFWINVKKGTFYEPFLLAEL